MKFTGLRTRLPVLLALAALMVVAGTVVTPHNLAVAQERPSSISGTVINGTDGAEVPDDLEVVLITINEETGQAVDQETKTVDADGRFSFDGLSNESGQRYTLAADAGAYVPSVNLANVEDWSSVELTIYEEMTSFDDISFISYAMIVPSIDPRTRTLGVLTVVTLLNSGDRVLVTDPSSPDVTGFDLLRFNLPENYSELEIESDLPPGNVMEINTGFALTNPVPPGEHSVLMNYIQQYEGDALSFPLRLPYGAETVRIMMPEAIGSVSGANLTETGTAPIGESSYKVFEGTGYERDSQVNVEFDGLPGPTLIQSTGDWFSGRSYITALVWTAGAAMLAMLAFALYTNRRKPSPSTESDGLPTDAEETLPHNGAGERVRLIQEIADLDEQHEAGEIGDDDYAERRDLLKRRVLGLRASDPGSPAS
ncbi:MAG: carboxypeptidase-like regulatory domain-containing protein [Dehalococcoidia bacterium]